MAAKTTSLHDQKVARVLSRYKTRRDVERILGDFVAEGIIEDSEEANHRRLLAEVRQIIGSYNNRQRRLGQPEKQVLNLSLYDENGERFQFYKRIELMDQTEALMFTEERVSRVRGEQKLLAQIFGYFAHKFNSFAETIETRCPGVNQLVMPFIDPEPNDA